MIRPRHSTVASPVVEGRVVVVWGVGEGVRDSSVGG